MWVLDHFEDVLSDLSVLHRVDDWQELPSSRFFAWAERLPAYQGAVRAALIVERPQPLPDWSAFESPAAPAADVDPSTLAALSDNPGFPGIEFTGG